MLSTIEDPDSQICSSQHIYLEEIAGGMVFWTSRSHVLPITR
jgi:hypothetical protein